MVRGEVPLAFTDTDDVYVAIRAGRAVDMVFPDQDGIGTLVIPNTVALINNGPHPDAGRRLIDYLLSEEVEARLASREEALATREQGLATRDEALSAAEREMEEREASRTQHFAQFSIIT